MVICAGRLRKPAALLLVAAMLLGCVTLGMGAIKKKLYPRGYADYVEKYSDLYGIDDNLIYAVIRTESGFDSGAVSNLGACGLMQLMPETFEWLRSKDKENAEGYVDVFDPETNIRYGVFFLSIIGRRFGEERLMIAAYHAGMGRVTSWLNDRSFSCDGRTLDIIPFSDTEHYVNKVERAKRIYDSLY